MWYQRLLAFLVPLALAACSPGGGGGGGSWELDDLPPVVLGGGGGLIGVDVSVNQPARLLASFAPYSEDGDDDEGFGAAIDIKPGTKSLSVEIPDDVYIYLELGIPDAEVGALFEWSVAVDGRQVWYEKDQLDQPLGSGYAFFGQVEAEDLADLRAWADY